MNYATWTDAQLAEERTRLQLTMDEYRATMLALVAEIEKRAAAVDTRVKLADMSDDAIMAELERRKSAQVIGVQLVEGVGDTPKGNK